MFGQVIRTGHEDPAHFTDTPGEQRGIGERADAYGHIEPFLYEVQVAVVQNELDLNFRVGIQKSRDERCDMTSPELYRRGNTQQSTGRLICHITYRDIVLIQ